MVASDIIIIFTGWFLRNFERAKDAIMTNLTISVTNLWEPLIIRHFLIQIFNFFLSIFQDQYQPLHEQISLSDWSGYYNQS